MEENKKDKDFPLRHINRIVYVEPNDVYGYGGEEGKEVPFTPPYEDMCIAFNLIIEKYSRFDNKVRQEYGFSWSDKQSGDPSFFSVLEGELKTKDEKLWKAEYDKNGKPISNYDSSYLTTYYTEISPDGYKKKEMVEGLGVTSIQVNFDSYYTPTVVINFVDVRGSALFGREEAIHTSASGSGAINADNIFGAFFTMPYPKFRLQMKGFYGRDVTYQLTVSNFKAGMNANTGNVEATVTFVGYTWSLLTDIPLTYLIAAPYCAYKGAEYWNEHVDSEAWRMENTPKSGATVTRPPKLFDLMNSIRYCSKEARGGFDGNSDKGLGKDISNDKTNLNKMLEYIDRFERLTTSKEKADIDKKRDEIEETYNKIKSSFDAYTQTEVIGNFDNDDFPSPAIKDNGAPSAVYEVADFSSLKNNIKKKMDILGKVTDGLIKEEQKEFISKSLEKIGIEPNIKNIFKVLMCHLETFCHILFQAAAEIKEQANKNERIPSALGVDIGNTDMPGRFGANTNLPPWTVIFNKDGENVATSDELKYKDMKTWVGRLNKNWVEEKVVLSIQNAIQGVSVNENVDEVGNNKQVGSIVSLPSDINLVDSIFSQVSKLGFDSICGNLGIRASQIFGIMDTTLKDDISMVNLLGEIDAYNYYQTCSSSDDIKYQILVNVNNGNPTNIITGVSVCDKEYDTYCKNRNNNGKAYHVFENDAGSHLLSNSGGKDGRQVIFLKKGGKYEYAYFYDADKKALVPSVLADFSRRGYDKYIRIGDGSPLHYEGVSDGGVTDGWLYSCKEQDNGDVVNHDMFQIISDKKLVEAFLKKYKEVQKGDFTVKDYTVDNADGFKKFTDRYWLVSHDKYKNMFPDMISCSFISVPFANCYKSSEKPKKDQWIVNKALWDKGFDGGTGTAVYEIGEEYGKLMDGAKELDISKMFIKTLYVYDSDGNTIGSLFGHPFYYTQNQITDNTRRRNAKAFLFLQSLNRGSGFFSSVFDADHGGFHIFNKANLLYIGGLLWRQEYYKEHSEDGILYTNPAGGPQYLECVNDKKILTIGDEGSLTIVKKTSFASLSDKKNFTTDEYVLGSNRWNNLEKNIKSQLISYFEEFAKTDFLRLANSCELKFKDGDDFKPAKDGKEFMEWINANCPKTDKEVKLYNSNYAFVYTNAYHFNEGIYMMFSENGDQHVQDTIKDVYFGRAIVMHNGSTNKGRTGKISIPANVYESYVKSFVDTLRTIHSSKGSSNDNYDSTSLKEHIDCDDNLLLSIYLYCKNIWEKWLMPLSGESSSTVTDENDMNENHFDVSHFFKNFVFIDSYYNDISKLLKINLDSLLKSYDGRSKDGNLFSFIGDIVAEHRCIFVGLPDFVNLGLGIDGENADGLQKMKDLFRAIPYNKMGSPRLDNHFVVIYTYPPSSTLPDEYSHRFDGFDIYSTDLLPECFKNANVDENLTSDGVTKYGYNVPAFGVSFGKQNNHIFKDFSLTMDNPVETEQSIKTLQHVAELASGNDRQVCFYGQDIYNIFTNYSYQIEVEMMGNAQIQPLMYFQLFNVPMWRGAYMIFNVSHTMTPGNMTTRFRAMKMSKNPVPILSSYWSVVPEASDSSENRHADVADETNVGDFDAPAFKISGQGFGKENEGASNKNLDVFYPLQGDCGKKEELESCYNRGHNNFYMPDLNTYVFTMKNYKEFNLKKAINFIYNFTFVKTSACAEDVDVSSMLKDPYHSEHLCARHVWGALQAGGLEGLNGGDAWKESAMDAMRQGGYEQIYSTGSTLPEFAFPGDVVLKRYKRPGKISGHAEFFTGKHWVSDAIQDKGLLWAKGTNTPNEKVFDEIYSIWRIPGIQDAVAKKGGKPTTSPVAGTGTCKNNNPGNVSKLKNDTWRGEVPSSGRFAVFESIDYGFRCLFINLHNTYLKNSDNTVRKIITRWAPAGDGKNDPNTYTNNVCLWMKDYGAGRKINPDEVIFTDSIKNSDPSLLKAFAKSVCRQEHSYVADDTDIERGLRMAIQYVK